MPLPVANRMKRLPAQFFAGLVQAAQERAAAGHDVINLGQGNPDQPTPTHVVERLRETATDPAHHRYCRFSGLAELKAAVTAWYRREFGVSVDPEREVCITIGAKLGLQEICLCLLNPGDRCLVPDPGYPDYLSGVALAGAIPVPMPLLAENAFLPDFRTLSPEDLSGAKLMFLNYPSNPTGATAPTEFIQDALTFARQHGLVLAWDAAYINLVYDGRRPFSILELPGARDVTVEFHTFSKSYSMAGWRIGFCVGNAEVIAAMNVLQDHLNCSQFAPIQLAAATALLADQSAVRQLAHLYEERRNAFVSACNDMGWAVKAPGGTFFVWCPVPGKQTSMAFAERLLVGANVVVAPGSGFGRTGEGYVRAALTTTTEQLQEATRRIAQLRII